MKNLETLIQELCPDGVEFVKLGDCCSFKRGTTITAKNAIPGDVPVLAGGQKPAYYHNEANRTGETIVVAGSGAYAGFVSYWTIPVFLSDSFSVEPDDRLVVKFVYYFLKNIQQKIFATKKGSGVPHVHGSSIEKFEIPLPPIKVQTEIVRILDKFTSLEAELEAELDCRRRQYEYYRDKLLSFDNVGGQEVEWKKMSEVCDIITDYVAAGSFAALRENVTYLKGKGYAQLVRTTDLKQNLTNVDDFIYVSKEAYDFLWRVNLNEESVVLPNIGVNCGEVYYITPNMFISDYNVLGPNAIKVRSNNENNHFLYYLFQTPFFQKEINKITSHAGQPKFNKTSLKNIVIPIPSLQEQERIANLLDRFESLTTSLQSGLPAEIAARRQQYEYYRDKLLTFKHKTA
mgnify:FL=1